MFGFLFKKTTVKPESSWSNNLDNWDIKNFPDSNSSPVMLKGDFCCCNNCRMDDLKAKTAEHHCCCKCNNCLALSKMTRNIERLPFLITRNQKLNK